MMLMPCFSKAFDQLIEAESFPGKNCSSLTNLPNATKLDEGSDEYQHVSRAFFKAIRMHRNKIRIVQVSRKYLTFVVVLFFLTPRVCNNVNFVLRWTSC